MDLTLQLRTWTHRRQRLADPARTAEQALRSVIGVYSFHPTAPLALFARTASLTPARFRRLDDRKAALRVPAMRRSIFLLPRRTAARVFTATWQPENAERRLGRYGITARRYRSIAGRIMAAATEPKTPDELRGPAGIEGEALGVVLRRLTNEGAMLRVSRGNLRSGTFGYVTTAAWIPEGLDGGDRDDALAWLAAEYLRAFGPARVEDFAWWTGLPRRTAARAMERPRTIDLGDGLLLLARDEAAFDRVTRLRGTVDVLPKWDSYTMGHAPDGRARFVHPDVQRRVYTPLKVGLAGDGQPVVLIDGEASGLWDLTRKGVTLDLFDTVGPRIRRRIDERLAAAAAFLDG